MVQYVSDRVVVMYLGLRGIPTRCPHAIADCAAIEPKLVEVAPGHSKACIRDDIL